MTAETVHDLFDWFALIWIPLFMGLATVAVSVAALVASSRATALAHEVERQREVATIERDEERKRQRMLDMSIEEARTLHRYAIELLKPFWRGRGHSLSDPAPLKTPLEEARDDARVMLGQSIVPGAQALLELTELDLSIRYEHLPEKVKGDDEVRVETLRKQLLDERLSRTFERIRDWALDPVQSEAYVDFALEHAKRDPEGYLASARRIPTETKESS